MPNDGHCKWFLRSKHQMNWQNRKWEKWFSTNDWEFRTFDFLFFFLYNFQWMMVTANFFIWFLGGILQSTIVLRHFIQESLVFVWKCVSNAFTHNINFSFVFKITKLLLKAVVKYLFSKICLFTSKFYRKNAIGT